jgi:hypothetical protein
MYQVPTYFLNKNWRRTTPMPRAKTELTINPKIVGARLTQELFKEWRKLGGAVWLRSYLVESQRKRNDAQNQKS